MNTVAIIGLLRCIDRSHRAGGHRQLTLMMGLKSQRCFPRHQPKFCVVGENSDNRGSLGNN
jgi:hypothetical protein